MPSGLPEVVTSGPLLDRRIIMSASLWRYNPEVCDGDYCPGDCTLCSKETEVEIIIGKYKRNEESEEESDD